MRQQLQPLTSRLFPPRVWIALEDGAVTVLTARGRRQPVQLKLLRRVPLPPGTCSDGEPQQLMALGDLIGDLLVELGLVGAEVVAVLPAAACDWRVVQWPFDDWPEEPDEALRQIDPDLALPYKLSQSYISLLPLDPDGTTTKECSSLLVTAPRQRVMNWIEVFDIAGVELERLEATQVCELRALPTMFAEAESDHRLDALLVPYQRGARLTLVRYGVPEYGGELKGSMDDVADQLERCVAYWRIRDSGASDVRLWLAGSSPDLPLLAENLRRNTDWPVEILDPVARGWISLPPDDGEQEPPPGPALLSLHGLMLA